MFDTAGCLDFVYIVYILVFKLSVWCSNETARWTDIQISALFYMILSFFYFNMTSRFKQFDGSFTTEQLTAQITKTK